MTTEADLNFPSGARLPYILRRKLEQQQQQARNNTESPVSSTNTTSLKQQEQQQSPRLPDDLLDRVFTAEELERQIWKTSAARVELQKQILRGEEVYYEETYGHGNIFKGWEGFLDARDVGVSSSATGPGAGSGSRRVPLDFRWFSGSCKSVSRTTRPTPIQTSLPQMPSLETPSMVQVQSTSSAVGITPTNSTTTHAQAVSTAIPTPVPSSATHVGTSSTATAAPVPAISQPSANTTSTSVPTASQQGPPLPTTTAIAPKSFTPTSRTTPRASPGPTVDPTVPPTTTTAATAAAADPSTMGDFKIPKKKAAEAPNHVPGPSTPLVESPATGTSIAPAGKKTVAGEPAKKRGRKRKSALDA